MSRKQVFICDGKGCGAVLVNPDDGFVILGEIHKTAMGGDAKVLVSNNDAPSGATSETSLCRDCLIKALELHAT
jgi:hypothetical protein